jgi:hypothetical protein
MPFSGSVKRELIIYRFDAGVLLKVFSQRGLSAATKSVFRLQVLGFRNRVLLSPKTYKPFPDESGGFTLTTHLRILQRSYDLRL